MRIIIGMTVALGIPKDAAMYIMFYKVFTYFKEGYKKKKL